MRLPLLAIFTICAALTWALPALADEPLELTTAEAVELSGAVDTTPGDGVVLDDGHSSEVAPRIRFEPDERTVALLATPIPIPEGVAPIDDEDYRDWWFYNMVQICNVLYGIETDEGCREWMASKDEQWRNPINRYFDAGGPVECTQNGCLLLRAEEDNCGQAEGDICVVVNRYDRERDQLLRSDPVPLRRLPGTYGEGERRIVHRVVGTPAQTGQVEPFIFGEPYDDIPAPAPGTEVDPFAVEIARDQKLAERAERAAVRKEQWRRGSGLLSSVSWLGAKEPSPADVAPVEGGSSDAIGTDLGPDIADPTYRERTLEAATELPPGALGPPTPTTTMTVDSFTASPGIAVTLTRKKKNVKGAPRSAELPFGGVRGASPDGGIIAYRDGTISRDGGLNFDRPGGTICGVGAGNKPVCYADGVSSPFPEAEVRDGGVVLPSGVYVGPTGVTFFPDGRVKLTDGSVLRLDADSATVTMPDGTVRTGVMVLPNGQLVPISD